MANHKSAKKRIRQTERRTLVNKHRKSKVKVAVRQVTDAVKAGDKKASNENLKKAESQIMRAASKGLLKKQTAARKVSRLVSFVKKAFSK